MSERKLLTKYMPKDWDPSAQPALSRAPKAGGEKSRIMIPFTAQCESCGAILGTSKKFNATKHYAHEDYLGIKIWRFHFYCNNCKHMITFKTDPKTRGYILESGATQLADKYSMAKELRAQAEAEKGTGEFKSNVDIIQDKIQQSAEKNAAADALQDLYEGRHQPSAEQLLLALAEEKRQKAAQQNDDDGDDVGDVGEEEFVKMRQQLEKDEKDPHLKTNAEINGLDCLFVDDEEDHQSDAALSTISEHSTTPTPSFFASNTTKKSFFKTTTTTPTNSLSFSAQATKRPFAALEANSDTQSNVLKKQKDSTTTEQSAEQLVTLSSLGPSSTTTIPPPAEDAAACEYSDSDWSDWD